MSPFCPPGGHGPLPRIPFDFSTNDDEDDSDEELRGLELTEKDGVQELRWPLVGVSVFHPTSEAGSPRCFDLKEIAKLNPGFRQHGMFGYSIERYSEFFAIDPYGQEWFEAELNFGKVEVTVGRVTPFARQLFWNYHDNDYMPEWEDIHSVRVFGGTSDQAETFLLNAMIAIRRELQLRLSLLSLETPKGWPPDEDGETSDEEQDAPVHCSAFAVSDIEPLRFFHRGLQDLDATGAFLQFYRVLEFYATLLIQDEVAQLRANRSLGARDFLVEILKASARDERTLLVKIVRRLADKRVLEEARRKELITSAVADELANALYLFRNAVVHAKLDFRSTIHSESVFEDSGLAERWRTITEELAARALERLGEHVP